MHRSIAATVVGPLVATVALVVATTALAAPAEAASFGVSLTLSRTKADVGKTLTASGKVTGSKAGKKLLTVQRRVGTGAWRKVGTTRTTSKGAFSYAYRVRSTGAQSLRVVAPATGSTKLGVSPARAFTGFTWVDLYDAPYQSGGDAVVRGPVTGWTVEGRKPPAHTLGLTSDAYVYWNVDSRCDAWRTDVAVPDGNPGSSFTVKLSAWQTTVLTPTSEAPVIHHLDTQLTGLNGLNVRRDESSMGGVVYLMTPQAHCSTSTLPVAFD
jgi:hypothetical protein